MGKHLGLSYIYDEPTSSAQKLVNDFNPLTPSVAIAVPWELLTNLQQAATRIDMDKIDKLIDEIRSHNTVIADKLAMLAADFKYDEILALIQQASD
jgi:hypothetical protein